MRDSRYKSGGIVPSDPRYPLISWLNGTNHLEAGTFFPEKVPQIAKFGPVSWYAMATVCVDVVLLGMGPSDRSEGGVSSKDDELL